MTVNEYDEHINIIANFMLTVIKYLNVRQKAGIQINMEGISGNSSIASPAV